MSLNSIYFRVATLLLFLVGTLINMLAYSSIQPALVLGFFLLIMLLFTWLAAPDEKKAFLFVFSICWFWAGISAIYAIYFLDFFQMNSDASNFYDLASGNIVIGLTVDQISSITTGAGAVILWQFIYNFFSFLGFDKGRYIGILLNIVFVSSTLVIGIKMVKQIFKEDRARILRFILLFSFCGTFWLFAAIHIRDASVLFAISLLALFWVSYLQNPDLAKMIKLAFATLGSFLVFALLRREFIFVPFAMLIAGFMALLLGNKTHVARTKLIIVAIFVLLPILGYLFYTTGLTALETIMNGNVTYIEKAENISEDNSLGTMFISNQPFPIRLFLSCVYLFVYPIPFWSGFQLQSSYHLFKSFHVMFMYIVTPLFVLGVWRVFRIKKLRTSAILFLLIVTIGFIIAIGLTSVETRHVGAFFLPLFVLSLIPDISSGRDKIVYQKLLRYYLIIILIGHLAWAILKLL
jgi:hypothetical protein